MLIRELNSHSIIDKELDDDHASALSICQRSMTDRRWKKGREIITAIVTDHFGFNREVRAFIEKASKQWVAVFSTYGEPEGDSPRKFVSNVMDPASCGQWLDKRLSIDTSGYPVDEKIFTEEVRRVFPEAEIDKNSAMLSAGLTLTFGSGLLILKKDGKKMINIQSCEFLLRRVLEAAEDMV